MTGTYRKEAVKIVEEDIVLPNGYKLLPGALKFNTEKKYPVLPNFLFMPTAIGHVENLRRDGKLVLGDYVGLYYNPEIHDLCVFAMNLISDSTGLILSEATLKALSLSPISFSSGMES